MTKQCPDHLPGLYLIPINSPIFTISFIKMLLRWILAMHPPCISLLWLTLAAIEYLSKPVALQLRWSFALLILP